MPTFNMAYTDQELDATIDGLSEVQLRALSKQYSVAELDGWIENLRDEVARTLVIRVKSKVATTFTGGWSGNAVGKNGPRQTLSESIYSYYDKQGDIVVTSSDPVMNILNAGFEPFDMKEKLMGRLLPLRLPGGRIIYRVVGDFSSRRVLNLNGSLKTKKGKQRVFYNTKNWIHPGYQGKHIYEQVATELKEPIEALVRDRVKQLLDTLDVNPYGYTKDARPYYNVRNNGKFSKMEFIGSAYQNE